MISAKYGQLTMMAAYLGVEKPDSITLNYERSYTFDSNAVKPNVVVVICESFSAYKSSMFGNKRSNTLFQ
jgi:hypothetical protein